MTINYDSLKWCANTTIDPATGEDNKLEPDTTIKNEGLKKGIRFPLEYINYQFNQYGSGLQDLQAQIDALTIAASTGIFNTLFPVGAIYHGTATNPNTQFGFGTWVRIQGKFIVGLDDSDTDFNAVAKTGGSKTHTHSVQSAGSHNHSGSTSFAGSHSHTGSTVAHALTVLELPSETPFTLRSTTAQTSDADPGATWPISGGQTASLTNTSINVNWEGGGQGHSHGISSDGSHQHTISSDGSHTHVVNSSSNLPPYFSTYIWRRTA